MGGRREGSQHIRGLAGRRDTRQVSEDVLEDREYRSAVDSVKPYEIWTYDDQGTYEFIFRDRRGVGVYELVHSTYPGELYNPNWQNEI